MNIDNYIKPGYKKTPVGIIPEDWEVKKISDLGDVVTGSTPKTTISEYYNGNELFVSPVDIQGNTYVNQTEKTLTELGIQQGRLVPKNSVLFVCIGSTIGKVSISGKDLITNQQINSIVPNKRTNFYFLFNILKQRAQRIKLLAANQAVPILNKSEFSKIKLPIPPLQEQKSIANCLSTWDSGIEKLTQLIQAKKLRKKGLMRQIFNGQLAIDNEQLPVEIRLKKVDKEEELLKGWKEAKLEQVSKIIMGVSPNSENYNFEGQGKFLIQGNADIRNRKSAPRQYTSEITKECQVGDILMSVRAPVGEIAESIHNACIGRGVCAIRNNKKADGKFLFYYLLNTEVLWSRFKQGSTFESVNSTDIRNFIIQIPSIEEQTAIAEILQAADKEIELLEQKLEAFKEQKKGLMQVLLTGERRLVGN